jgi:hypothetical protein
MNLSIRTCAVAGPQNRTRKNSESTLNRGWSRWIPGETKKEFRLTQTRQTKNHSLCKIIGHRWSEWAASFNDPCLFERTCNRCGHVCQGTSLEVARAYFSKAQRELNLAKEHPNFVCDVCGPNGEHTFTACHQAATNAMRSLVSLQNRELPNIFDLKRLVTERRPIVMVLRPLSI